MKLLKNPALYVLICLAAAMGLFAWRLWALDILSLQLFGIVLAIDVILALIAGICLFKKGWGFKTGGWILAVVLVLVNGIGFYSIQTAYDMLLDMTTPEGEVRQSASCFVYRAGPITDVQGLEGANIGYLRDQNNEGTAGVIEELKENGLQFNLKQYDSSLKLVQDLKGMKLDAVILNDSYLRIISDYEGQEDIADELVSVVTYNYTVSKQNESDNVNVTNTPFTVLISGIDTYGDISETSRSDVNLVVSVNPNTRDILMISIPRDYYVETVCEPEQGCANGQMDKLTHTGLHGIMTTEMTLEKLLDTQINYNVRVNFSSLETIVNELGGITVNNPNEFSSGGYQFAAGDIQLDGAQALAFSRERYSFMQGDRERGRNHMRVLEGIIRKIMSPAILKNYGGILAAVSDSIQTNMSVEDMTSLVKMQLEKGGSWNIYDYSLNGGDGQELAYELGDVAYVMYPNNETVKHAKDDLKAIQNGETPPYKNN